MNNDPRRHAPAASRNRGPILKILRQYLPKSGKILEIASGTGEHISYFAAAMPDLNWQPTDIDTEALASIAAYCEDAALANLSPPRRLDHIAPWSCCVDLVRGAAKVLEGCSPLILYGPFKRNGIHTAPTNAAFDRRLRENNFKWGLRDIEAVEAEARNVGLDESTVIDMPSNNYCLILRRGITHLE
jgi:hypothetical protein